MQYLLLIHLNDEAIKKFPGPFLDEVMAAHFALQEELTESGELVSTNELRPPEARSVRTDAETGETLITDGPFTEGREWVAGYYIVECANVERATEIAARLGESRVSPVEVRPIWGNQAPTV